MGKSLIYVMSVLCDDRPGQVERVATVISQCGGNWLESRMCRLGGRFAGILRVSIPDTRGTELLGALNALESQGISVVVQTDEALGTAAGDRLFSLHLLGQDRPGIVQQVSHAVALLGYNVEDLRTECRTAPWSGESLFEADILLKGPAGADTSALRQSLERISGDLMVDIDIAEIEDER